MVIGLGHGRPEAALELRLEGLKLLALALEAAVLRKVQMPGTQTKLMVANPELRQGLLHLLRLVHLQHISFLDVREVLEHDAALEAGRDLADVVLEAAERGDAAVVDDGAVADQADLGAAPDRSVDHVAAGDRPDAGGLEGRAPSTLATVSSTSSGSSMPSIASRRSSITL